MTDKPEVSAADVLAVLGESAAVLEVIANGYSGTPQHRKAAKKAREVRAAVASVYAERDALAAENEALRRCLQLIHDRCSSPTDELQRAIRNSAHAYLTLAHTSAAAGGQA